MKEGVEENAEKIAFCGRREGHSNTEDDMTKDVENDVCNAEEEDIEGTLRWTREEGQILLDEL